MAQQWVEVLERRNRTSKTKRLYVDGEPTRKYSCDVNVAPVHYQDIEGDWQDIDTTLIPSTRSIPGFGNPALEMVENEYEMFVLDELNSGVPLVRYRSDHTDHWVQFAAHNLQWTNDLDQIASIATPSTTATVVSGNEAKWADAYGTGIDLRFIAGLGRMSKWLDIANPLAPPPQYIIDGGNPCIEFCEILEFDRDLEVWVNGEKWDKKADVGANTEITFKSPAGEIQFVFPQVATGHDDEGNPADGQLYLKRQGPNLYVMARFPWAWMQSAAYPIHLDTTVDVQVGASADDSTQIDNSSGEPTAEELICGNFATEDWHDGHRFNVTIPASPTIDVAHLTFYPDISGSEAVNYSIYGEDGATPAAFGTGTNDISNRTRTTAFASENPPANWVDATWVNSASIVSVIQELADTYDYSSGLYMVLMRIMVSGSGERVAEAWDKDSTHAAKLHIEYTAAGGETFYKSVAGSITPSGALMRAISKFPSGAITPSGALVRKTSKGFAGTLTSSGVLTSIPTFVVSLAGTLTSAGTLGKKISKSLAGTLTSAGVLVKKTSKALTGTLTSSGALGVVFTAIKSLAGTLTSAGALGTEFTEGVAQAAVRLYRRIIG